MFILMACGFVAVVDHMNPHLILVPFQRLQEDSDLGHFCRWNGMLEELEDVRISMTKVEPEGSKKATVEQVWILFGSNVLN